MTNPATIYKYTLDPGATVSEFRLRGRVLSAGVQQNDIVVWAVHDETVPAQRVRIHVMGTGHDFVDAPVTAFVGTVFMGPLVFHVFATYLSEAQDDH